MDPDTEEPDNAELITPPLPFKELPGGYVSFQGKHIHKDALFGMYPNLKLVADNNKPVKSDFGARFPDSADRGDIFTRVDVLPNKVFKFDGKNWISINKETTNTYLHNTKYLDFLIERLETGQYDPELLSEEELLHLEDHLKLRKLHQKH